LIFKLSGLKSSHKEDKKKELFSRQNSYQPVGTKHSKSVIFILLPLTVWPPAKRSCKKNFYVTEMAKLSEKLYLLTRKWLAIYSRPRWEKKVAQLLTEKGLECYCPLNKVRRKWSDRMKTVEEPLFKSYVFVRVNDEDRTAVRMTPGVINFVYWDGKPALIKEKEINAIKQFLNEYENVEVRQIEVEPNQRVKITRGPLMDQEGKVMEVHRKTVKIAIDSLGYVLVAYIDRSKLSSSD
jgi:transcription antitermination factor NusG